MNLVACPIPACTGTGGQLVPSWKLLIGSWQPFVVAACSQCSNEEYLATACHSRERGPMLGLGVGSLPIVAMLSVGDLSASTVDKDLKFVDVAELVPDM